MKELKKWMPMFVGEYLADTGHLSTAEHGAYLLLIFHYWVKGGVPWENDEMVRRITKLTPRQWALSRNVLRSFFGDDGHHKRCDIELAYALEKSRVNSTNVSKRYIGRRLPVDTPTPTPTPTKKESSKRGTRLPPDWSADVEYATKFLGSPELVAKTMEDFKDYWSARADSGAIKRDWDATWRRWVRQTAEKKGILGPRNMTFRDMGIV